MSGSLIEAYGLVAHSTTDTSSTCKSCISRMVQKSYITLPMVNLLYFIRHARFAFLLYILRFHLHIGIQHERDSQGIRQWFTMLKLYTHTCI